MLTLDTSTANPQLASPLFTRLPTEIRDSIFALALTPHTAKQQPYPQDATYYRPNFRYADRHISCALLRTCRRVLQETHSLPAQNYVSVEWHSNGPPEEHGDQEDRPARKDTYHRDLQSAHLFMQQVYLEGWDRLAEERAEQAPHLRNLKITIRHSDWWSWEAAAVLELDAKQAGKAIGDEYRMANEPFDYWSWGKQLYFFKDLRIFELELETVEGKRQELDSIVARASGWKFPLQDGKVLILDPAKTKRKGWHGRKIPGGIHAVSDPFKAKERLKKDGVDFSVEDGEPEMLEEGCLTYYVVKLTYERGSALG